MKCLTGSQVCTAGMPSAFTQWKAEKERPERERQRESWAGGGVVGESITACSVTPASPISNSLTWNYGSSSKGIKWHYETRRVGSCSAEQFRRAFANVPYHQLLFVHIRFFIIMGPCCKHRQRLQTAVRSQSQLQASISLRVLNRAPCTQPHVALPHSQRVPGCFL